MDAKEISKKVRSYFEEVHGALAVLLFRIESVSHEKKINTWIVECSFNPGSFVDIENRVRYKVFLDAQGNISAVNEIPAAPKAKTRSA